MNVHVDRGHRPATRPLPGGMPEYIVVELIESEYHHQKQWVARYRLYHNGNESDFIDVVVNIPRRSLFQPQDGERWWVRPTAMAPHKRLVFAESYGRVGGHSWPLTVRTGEEFFLTFQWSQRDRDYRTVFDGWQVRARGALGICRDELWQVQVERIDPCAGLIEVRSIGPHRKMRFEPPKQVGYIGITPLFGGERELEGDVFEYGVRYWNYSGGQLSAKIEHNGRLIRLDCSQMRKVSIGRNTSGKEVFKIVGLVSQNDGHRYLAEIVLIEGEVADRPQLPAFDEPPRVVHHRPFEERDALDEVDDGLDEYFREIRENSEPPDRDEY